MHSLRNINKLIDEDRASEALEILNRRNNDSIWLQNAKAVCMMRSGENEKAANILINVVYRNNSIVFAPNIPDVIKLNLVTAMFLTGNIDGAVSVLNEVKEDCPQKKTIEAAFRKWKKEQSFWYRFLYLLGIISSGKPFNLDFPPGQIEFGVEV